MNGLAYLDHFPCLRIVAIMGNQYALQCLLLPPGLLVVLLILGLVLSQWYQNLGKALILVCTIILYSLSIPSMPTWLAKNLQIYPPLNPNQIKNTTAQAIVVLSAGRYYNAPEYGGDTTSGVTLLRLRYTAYLYRMTKLPILLSGGRQAYNAKADAILMKTALQKGFHIKARWLEYKSANTWGNAKYSAILLKKNHIHHILLVTSAIHMRRAVFAFTQHHIQVTAAPTLFVKTPPLIRSINYWLPNRFALFSSIQCLYEYLGLTWYQIKHTTMSTTAHESSVLK